MRLLDIRDRVVEHLRIAVPDFLDVQPHGGRFNVDDLKRYIVKAPAARVAFIGVSREDFDSAGRLIGPAAFAVFIITTGADPASQGLDLAEKVSDAVAFQQWGLADIEAAIVHSIDNLYSADLDRDRVAIYGVTFQQKAAWGTNRAEADMAAQPGLTAMPAEVRSILFGEEDAVFP